MYIEYFVVYYLLVIIPCFLYKKTNLIRKSEECIIYCHFPLFEKI